MLWFDEFWKSVTLILYIANIILVVYACVSLLLQKENTNKTISWMIVIILFPYIGILLYIFIGRNFRKEKMYSRKGAIDFISKTKQSKAILSEINKNGLPEELAPHSKLILQNLKSSHSPLTIDSEAEIYFDGKSALLSLLETIEGAKQHIHIQSYIIEEDEIGNRFKDALIAKSQEGVEVRFMFDGFGSRALSKKYLNSLREAGVEVLNFSPFRWFFFPLFANYRNHRKIAIIDGKIGYLGGVNIADRYFNGGVFPEWRDTHVKLVGQSVSTLQSSFLLDRFFILNNNLLKRRKYYQEVSLPTDNIAADGKFYSQIISSGPDSDWSGIMNCYFTAITQAKKSIYIITPYFIPTEFILNAIKVTALSGVNINLMIPEKSDSWLTHWGTMSYITELLEVGVKIYLFQKGFNHSKVLSIDGEYCIIGSANMDTRSLEHHFEVTSILYSSKWATIIEEQFKKDIHRCTSLTMIKWRRRKKIYRVYESLARLLSPLL